MKRLDRQNIIDLAIEHSGSAGSALELAMANGITITDDVQTGTELISVPVVDGNVVEYFRSKKIHPATDVISGGEVVLRYFGIEFPREFE